MTIAQMIAELQKIADVYGQDSKFGITGYDHSEGCYVRISSNDINNVSVD